VKQAFLLSLDAAQLRNGNGTGETEPHFHQVTWEMLVVLATLHART
jgi:hypothetical protein